MDPENPLTAYVLNTTETAGDQTGQRAFLFLDAAAAAELGERLKASKPAEVASFDYVVLPLEGAPV